jgi:MFS family permease
VQIFINVGTLLSYVSNYAFAGLPVHIGWRLMFGIGVVPPAFVAAGVFFMPESPRWLAMRGRHADARAVLLRTTDTPADADLRLSEIKQAVAHQPAEGGNHGGVWKELVFRPSASVRRVLACVIGLEFFVPASGVEAILLYSPRVFKAAGMASTGAALGATVAIGAVKTFFILIGVLLTDRVGRRPLLLVSTAGVAVTMAALALTLSVGTRAAPAAAPAMCLATVLAVVATFSIGYALVVNTYSAEILPMRLRAQGLSMGVAVNRLTSGLVTMTFISLADAITLPGCFFLFAGLTAAAFVFVYTRLPETKGRRLEDMDVLFDK